ncbi:MAG: TIGR01777 family oxidoreductase [Thermoflexibacter sp.]
MTKNVLITGGTGLVGQRLSEILLNKGYSISYLTRNKKNTTDFPQIKLYEWNIRTNEIEEEAIQKADYIIHLAGAGVADEKWTPLRKKEILESRTLSTQLLVDKINTTPNQVQAFVSASAIGYYGLDTGNTWQYENTESQAKDFLAEVVKAWESTIFKTQKVRTVAIRIGVVLSQKGGALEKMAQPVRFYTGAALGSGLQYISWIHIDDLCEIFAKALEDSQMSGIYNGVAPNPVTNEVLTKTIGKVLNRPILPVNVPAFALKLALGEMAGIVLGGNRVSSEKIEKAGYKFRFTNVEDALTNLLV